MSRYFLNYFTNGCGVMSYKELLKVIGGNIKRIRENDCKVSLNYAAKKALMEWKRFDAIEKGSANPTVKTLYRIAEVLDISVDQLFEINKSQPKTLEPTIEDIKRAGRRLSN